MKKFLSLRAAQAEPSTLEAATRQVRDALIAGRPLLLEAPTSSLRDQAALEPLLAHFRQHEATLIIAARDEERLSTLSQHPVLARSLESTGISPSLHPSFQEEPRLQLFTLEQLARRLRRLGESALPHNAVLYFDDADFLGDTLRTAFTRTFSADDADALAQVLERHLEASEAASALRREAARFFDAIRDLPLREPFIPVLSPALGLPWFALVDALADAVRCLSPLEASAEARSAAARADSLRRLLEECCERPLPDHAYFYARIERAGAPDRIVVISTPLEAGPLAAPLFKRAWSAILAGPALFSTRNTELMRLELELPAQTTECRIARAQRRDVVLLIPDECASVLAIERVGQVERLFAQVRRTVPGPLLALITHYRLYRSLSEPLPNAAIDAVDDVIFHFCQEPLEVPTSALGCHTLFLEQLPFPRFFHPVTDAWRESIDAFFGTVYLPRAVRAFRALVARWLEASPSPRFLVVADNRLLEAAWSGVFLKNLGLRIEQDVRVLEELQAARTASSKTGKRPSKGSDKPRSKRPGRNRASLNQR